MANNLLPIFEGHLGHIVFQIMLHNTIGRKRSSFDKR
jgi:hypothetical protein